LSICVVRGGIGVVEGWSVGVPSATRQERNREQAHTIIRSIAHLSHSLGIRVTA